MAGTVFEAAAPSHNPGERKHAAARSWQLDGPSHGWPWRARVVHGHAYEDPGTVLRTALRAFRGVHTPDRPLDVATDEAVLNATRVTPTLIRRMCLLSGHTGYT